jgi:hypothetical protein
LLAELVGGVEDRLADEDEIVVFAGSALTLIATCAAPFFGTFANAQELNSKTNQWNLWNQFYSVVFLLRTTSNPRLSNERAYELPHSSENLATGKLS